MRNPFTRLYSISRTIGSGNEINLRNMQLCSRCILSNVQYGVVSLLETIVLDMEMIDTTERYRVIGETFLLQQFRANLTFLLNKIRQLNTRSVQGSSF